MKLIGYVRYTRLLNGGEPKANQCVIYPTMFMSYLERMSDHLGSLIVF